jgi:hypothetical protein
MKIQERIFMITNKHFKFYKLLLFLTLFSVVTVSYAADGSGYDWPSGYKIQTQRSKSDGSKFKGDNLTGGVLDHTIENEVHFPVYQGNWIKTYPACRDLAKEETILKGVDTDGDGKNDKEACEKVIRSWKYMCKGTTTSSSVSSDVSTALLGGDTMYGIWGALFSYLPPVAENEDCSKTGRCFVANAWAVDTKTQYEKKVTANGVEDVRPFTGFGMKVLKEGPGDVYFFDQVRAYTQAPTFVKSSTLFNPVQVIGQ